MPGYRVHLIGGSITAFILYKIPAISILCNRLSASELISCILVALAGSLFPDIDIKSKGQHLFAVIAAPAVLISILGHYWKILAICSLAMLLPLCAKHRGITHRPLFIILFPLVLPIMTSAYASQAVTYTTLLYLFFVAGALSHIILDFGIIKTITPHKQYKSKKR